MAKLTSSGTFMESPKVSRPGVHAKTKTSRTKSSKNYKKNPASRKKKAAYDKEYASSEERKNYRVKLNLFNRKKGKKGDGKDVDHKDRNTRNNSTKNLRVMSKSRNRSRK